MFHFTELEKLFFFLLKTRSNSKITLIKTKGIVIYHGNNNGGNNDYREQKDKETCSSLKMLEAISVLVYFHEHSPFTGQLGKGEAISLTPHTGKRFWTKNLWGGYSKNED